MCVYIYIYIYIYTYNLNNTQTSPSDKFDMIICLNCNFDLSAKLLFESFRFMWICPSLSILRNEWFEW